VMYRVGTCMVHCPFPCDVLAMYQPGTLVLAPSVCTPSPIVVPQPFVKTIKPMSLLLVSELLSPDIILIGLKVSLNLNSCFLFLVFLFFTFGGILKFLEGKHLKHESSESNNTTTG